MNKKIKVLIADKMSNDAQTILEKNGIETTIKVGLKEDALTKELIDYDGLLIRSATKVTAQTLSATKRIKVIGRAGIGVDNVDIKEATQKGIIVMNTPTGNTVTTAEHAISMMFAAARQIPYASEALHRGEWVKSGIKGSEITGKTLGVIGSGNIGSIVVSRAIALKMKVIIYDPFLSSNSAEEKGASLVTLDKLLAESDFITIHTPLNNNTKNLINQETIQKMKKGCILVNCARGGIVNEDDLAFALKEGYIAAAALDVFTQEPLQEGSPLRGINNLILTPHLGASTVEAQERVASEIAQQISDYLLQGMVSNAINFISLDAQTSKELPPYQNMCFQLGNFIAQIVESGFNKVVVEYEGKINQFPHRLLNQWVVYGLLKPSVENVNFINSLMVAKSRDIDLKETVNNSDSGEYQTLVTVQVVTDKRQYSVSGTLLGHNIRIVAINKIAIESDLSNENIYIENQDKPGLIRNLSGLLFDNKINIGTFHLGRDIENDVAIALVGIDTSITDSLLNEIQNLPLVIKAKHIRF